MVVIKYKELSTEIRSYLYGRNELFTNYWDRVNNNINIVLDNIDTRLNTLKVKGYRGLYKFGLCVIDRDLNKGRGDKKYSNDEERKQAHNKQSLDSYHNRPENIQFKKDTEKETRSDFKYKLVKANKEFYTQYQFNYFISLQFGFVLDKQDKNVTYLLEDKTDNRGKIYSDKEAKKYLDFDELRSQNKNQIKKNYDLDTVIRIAENYIKSLVKYGIPIFDNYYFVIHQNPIDKTYHIHIAINVINTTIVNVHTYLQNRWHYNKSKKKMVKKIHNQEELIGYMNEEKKNINGNTVYDDCNLNKHSKRLPNQSDLTDNLDYALNTFIHPETQITLRQYGIR